MIQLDKKPGRLFDTVAQAMSGIVYAAEKKEIAVSVDCPEDLTVSHDSSGHPEALFNLLDNAVKKYTPAGGNRCVSGAVEMYVEIKVTDTGKEFLKAIRPLSSGASIVRKKYTNSRRGHWPPYLAREIVTRQGGYIKVVSGRAGFGIFRYAAYKIETVRTAISGCRRKPRNVRAL